MYDGRVIRCEGSPLERGLGQGETLRSTIRDGLDRWAAELGARHDVPIGRYVDEFLSSTSYAPAISRFTPELMEEMRGIASGAGQPFNTILAFNLLDEEWLFGQSRGRPPRGCTSAGFVNRPSGRRVIGQTMDLPSVHDGTQVAVNHVRENGPDVTVLTAAGMVALTGVNSVGVGVVVNALQTLEASTSGLPVAFVIRGILDRPNATAAEQWVRSLPHATGQHYLIGDPERLLSLECGANGVSEVDPGSDRFCHANHPLTDGAPVHRDKVASGAANSLGRQQRMGELLPGLETAGDLETALADRSAPISRSGVGGWMTFGAIVIELARPPRMRFTAGPPHERKFQEGTLR
jgi:isopenicillin-N N-acyltransferase like protein